MLEPRRKLQRLAERLQRLIDGESGVSGGDLQQVAVRVTEVDAVEILPVLDVRHVDARADDPLLPDQLDCLVRHAEGNMVDLAGAGDGAPDGVVVHQCHDQPLGRGRPINLEDEIGPVRVDRVWIFAGEVEAQHVLVVDRCRLAIGRQQRGVVDPADRHRGHEEDRRAIRHVVPGWGNQLDDQPVRIAEPDGRPGVVVERPFQVDPLALQMAAPPCQRRPAGNPQGDVLRPAPAALAMGGVRPFEEGQQRPRRADLVAVADVADIRHGEIDRLLDQPQPQQIAIEAGILPRVAGDHRQVVIAAQRRDRVMAHAGSSYARRGEALCRAID